MLSPLHDGNALAATGFDALKRAARRDDPAAVREAAQQFEALLLQQVMKSAREAGAGEGLFSSARMDHYHELFDKQVALALAREGGLGLAEQLVRQLTAAQVGTSAAARVAGAGQAAENAPKENDGAAANPANSSGRVDPQGWSALPRWRT